MRLLLDMGVSRQTAAFLRGHGFEAIHLAEQGLQKMSDSDIMKKALLEGSIIITFDLDFAHLLSLQRLYAPSVILFRLEEFTTSQINERLEKLLEQYSNELNSGAIVVVEPDRIRIRRLPIWPTE